MAYVNVTSRAANVTVADRFSGVLAQFKASFARRAVFNQTVRELVSDAFVADIEAAGFKFDSESKILANPADDHSKGVFDPSIRGKTDQFVLKFRKPGKPKR